MKGTRANVKPLIRLLMPEDEHYVQKLCEECHEFALMMGGRPPRPDDGHKILFDLPPGMHAENKYVYGLFTASGTMIAVLDMVSDYKVKGEWTIGLMMITPAERGKGFGRHLHDLACDIARRHGASVMRLGVMKENHAARRFWRGLGYQEMEIVRRRYDKLEHTVIIKKRNL